MAVVLSGISCGHKVTVWVRAGCLKSSFLGLSRETGNVEIMDSGHLWLFLALCYQGDVCPAWLWCSLASRVVIKSRYGSVRGVCSHHFWDLAVKREMSKSWILAIAGYFWPSVTIVLDCIILYCIT